MREFRIRKPTLRDVADVGEEGGGMSKNIDLEARRACTVELGIWH
jgi:hypothetical protein